MSSSASSLKSKPEGYGEAPSLELRASVLDAAVSLGFRNSVMKKWMFDPVVEGDEDEHADHTSSTPALTSPSTSEESAMSPYSFFCPPGKPNSVVDTGPTDPFFLNGNANISQSAFSHDDGTKGSTGRVTPSNMHPRNKLRKTKNPKSAHAGSGGGGNGYETDSGYVSDFAKKAKKSLRWRSKGKDSVDDEDGESEGGYRSEAASSVSKAKKKAREKNKGFLHDASPPHLPPMALDDRDPGSFLATINASALPEPNSPSGSDPSFARGPTSSSGHGHTTITDGYLTDSASSEKRGRTKKAKSSRTSNKSKSRATSPSSTEDLKKKKSLFRLVGRSISRDAKDRNRSRRSEEEPPPPLPEPRPPVPLPIAERFARSGTATPVGNASASATLSSLSKLDIAGSTRPSLELRSSASLDTLVPPRLAELVRADSPWSNHSAPGRIGITNGQTAMEGRSGSGAASLELPRKNSNDMSPFSVMQKPEDGASAGNGEREHMQGSREPPWYMTPIVPSEVPNGNSSSDLSRSPTKRIGKLLTNLVHPSDNKGEQENRTTSPSSPKPLISHPNPHLTARELDSFRFPKPVEVAAASTKPTNGLKATVDGNAKDLGDSRPITPESFMIIDEDDAIPTPLRQQRFAEANADANTNADGNEPSSSNFLAPARPSTPTTSPLGARRRALLHGLGLDITPTQSRSATPVPAAIPSEEEAKAARASVLAYYQVPPPSPPPTGPLPTPPRVVTPPVSGGLMSSRQENEAQLLSPLQPFASRSPSPLGPGARYAVSRSPSPGMGVGQGVRRGRESPFPTRPILPPQDSRQLVENVQRNRVIYATDGAGSDEPYDDEPGWEKRRDQEFIDKHSSEYIRQARARGEKRVYFDIRQSYISNHGAYGDADALSDDVDPVIPEIEVKSAEESSFIDVEDEFDEEADERLRHSKLDSPSRIRELLRGDVKDEFEDGETLKEGDGERDDASSSRRSFAASSVYSNYEVLEADESARIRDGFVKRVAALYGNDHGRLLKEEIPDVPKLPSQFRADAAAGQPGRTQLKITSSRYRF